MSLGKRVLIAKAGLDGHDVGAKMITLALCDAEASGVCTHEMKLEHVLAAIDRVLS